ncbi:MAG TPA: plastocyanin/azurin family copper-binding protein [Gemmatimonadaceae bacterium]|nr:plastocyanin/azurin family copper-binding protein [Gemmatimonadaceae bacterium]
MRHAARLPLLLLLAAAGCGGSSTAPGGNNSGGNNPPPQNNPGNPNSITVSNNYFDPTSTTISPNTKVTWTWSSCSGDGYGGQTCVAHNILFDDGTASGSLSDGTWSRTFTTAGTYKYHCSVHGSAMSGTIVVQ